MAGKDSEDGYAKVVGGAVIGIIVVISMVPKQVWIGLGIVAGVALLAWGIYKGFAAIGKLGAAAEERDRAVRAAEAAAAQKHRDAAIRQAKQDLITLIGEKSALLVDSARASVEQVQDSEAAQAGWLGDVDFTADVNGIIENFRKAHDLRAVADELSALANPSADDRRILGEAKGTAERLEHAGIECVRLISKCAGEAKRVDESLRKEREEARTAEQRAQLHAKLSGMLYGIEATPAASPEDSTADAVMARVAAYREIKSRIQRV